jgi:hypothetical protein
MSQYILSLLVFVVNNSNQFLINSEIHNIYTRRSSILHLCSANIDVYQKGVYHSGIKISNILPLNMKKFSDNSRTFKGAFKKFLYMNSLCTLYEFYNNK